MKEIRICNVETRDAEPGGNSGLSLTGRPVVFDTPTVINDPQTGPYTEIIHRGALDHADMADSRLLVNHDLKQVPLARTPKTMHFTVEPGGLRVDADLAPEMPAAQNAYGAVKRGDLSGMSFSFIVAPGGDKWTGRTREISSIAKVFEVSLVSFPAYPQTSVEARAALESIEKSKGDSRMEITVQDIFNKYRTSSIEQIEQRAAELRGMTGGDADAIKIELEGLEEAKKNIQEKMENRSVAPSGGLHTLSSMSFGGTETRSAEPHELFKSNEYYNAFYKSLMRPITNQPLSTAEINVLGRARDILVAEGRAADFGTTTNTPSVVPTRTLDEIISKARKEGGILSVARRFNMPAYMSMTIGIPQPPANSHEEGECIDTDRPETVELEFGAHEILKIFSISNKLQVMSVPSFESYLIDELYGNYMGRLNIWLTAGETGKGQGLNAISFSANDNLIQYTGTPTYQDFVSAMARLKRGYSSGAYWAMSNRTLYESAYGMVDTAGRPIFIDNPQDQSVGRILGKPVIVDDYLADGDIYLGNFNYLGYNMVQAPLIEISRDSSFHCGKIDYRVIGVADSKPIIDEAFVLLAPSSPQGSPASAKSKA